MRKLCWLSGLLVWLSMAGAAQAALAIYYLRHGEAGHNVVKQFVQSGTPTNQWPAYVGNPNMFTPTGESQVRGVAAKLVPYKFDLIAVSPLWRTRHTILPYLKATGQTAEIWPELTEAAHFDPVRIPGPAPLVTGAHSLQVPAEEKSVFKLRTDPAGCCTLSATNGVEAFGLAAETLRLLRARFGTHDATVLVVGHGTAGETLIRYLLHNPDWTGGAQNATIWMAQERSDGTFELKMFNGASYPISR